MTLKTNSAEGGTDGAGTTGAVTTGNSGGVNGSAFAAVTPGAGGTINYVTGGAHGNLAYEFTQATAATSCFFSLSDTAADTVTVRAYLYLTAYPSAAATFPVAVTNASNSTIARLNLSTAGIVSINSFAGLVFTGSVALSLTTWYRLEFGGTGFGTLAGTLFYGLYLGDATGALESTSLTSQNLNNGAAGTVRYGKLSSSTLASWRMDDIAQNIGSSAPLGPLATAPAPPVPPARRYQHLLVR